MADEQGTAKAKKSQERRLGNVEFFKLCEELRNRREVLTTQRPLLVEAAKQLSEWLKFEIAPQTVRQAQKVTGIEWTPQRAVRSLDKTKAKSITSNSGRVLCAALYGLYKEVQRLTKALENRDIEIPPSLQRLKEYYDLSRGGVMMGGGIESIGMEVDAEQNGTPPADPLPPTGTTVFKVGDEVILDGSPFKRHTVRKMSGNGRFAILDDNHEVQVSRLKLCKR